LVPDRPSGPIEGVKVLKLTRHEDQRGFLYETYRLDELPAGLTPVMSYISYTRPGIARGPHEHTGQTDIFSLPGPGNFLLKLWDNRSESPTFGQFMSLTAGSDNPLTIVVPPGVIHGYKNISTEDGMVLNYPDRLFMGQGKKGPLDEVRHEDDPDSPYKMD